MSRVILYKGTFAYDAVNVFIDELAGGFAAIGREAEVIDLTVDKAHRAARVRAALSRPFECIVALAGIGFHPRSAELGPDMYRELAGPYVAVLVDHPARSLEMLALDGMVVTCYDRTHVAFLKRYCAGRLRVEFMPHGGSRAPDGDPAAAERAIDVLFPGTYADVDECYAGFRAAFTGEDFELMDFVVERLLTSDCEPMEDALAAVLAAEGRSERWRELAEWLPALEAFVKAYKRYEVLKRLDQAGIAVDICGSNWPAGLFRRHRVRDAMPYRDVLRLMQHARIVLNLGFVPDGSHERIFSSLLNGALPASDYSPYVAGLFDRGCGPLLFRWTEMGRLPEQIAAALADRATLERYPVLGPQLAQHHTWADRARSLLETLARPPQAAAPG